MRSKFNKFLTLLVILTLGITQLWAADPVENVGTYSTQVISADGTTSTWTFITPGSQVTIPTSPAETEDNDIIFHPGGGSKMKFSSSNGLSWSGNSDGYIYVPAGAAGSISMTVKSASDSRWLQLYVGGEDQGSTKRLWSKEANPATAARGPRTFTFTSSDLTTKGTKTYLHLKDNNTELKIATFTVTLTTGSYLNGGGSTDPVSEVNISGATTGYATVPVALTATPDETATGYKWFVDGVEQDGKTSATFNFEAATPGTYSVVAKARNDYNATDEWIASSAHTVTISKLCGELIKIVQNGQNDGTVTGILTGTKDVKLSSGTSEYDEKTGRKIGSDNYWLGITSLSKPLRAGDVATVFVTTASAKLQLFSDKGTTLIGELASGVVQGENEIVLNSSATGATAIYLYRTTTAGSDMNPYVHSLSVTRSCTESDDCSISDVTINSEAITPVGKVYSYEVAAASALTEVAVTYSIHPLATAVPASGFTVAVPTVGDPANTQTITVTAEDGTHSDTYTISVSKATAASDVVTLDALAVTGYTLSPVFDAATLAYTITKDYGTADPTADKVTYTKSEEAQKVDVVYDGTNHKFVVTVTAEDNTTTQDYEITINEAEAKRGLLTVPFSNGAKGAINAAGLEIRVPYIGASEPTIVLAGIEYQDGVAGATASMEAGKLRITGADSNYDDYTLTFVQLTPSALTLDELVTFDDVPSYAFAPYGWDSGKGVKFAKNVEEASNHRVSLGNTRVYFAIQACDEVQLTSGSGGARNVKIYVNGVLSSVNKTAASGSAIKLALDNTQANFIAIESNQTGGDGGFTKILVKALADNTLAYTDGAYTTGEAALDLSTLISTSNSDGAITYVVKTDGGTNASIAGNNFTATVAGTATITATQVASETIRQKSVDFNVVVTAGATKYTVTFDAQGGSAVDPQEVTEGESPVEPTAPTKDEYIFQGWSETTDGAVVDVTSFTINAPKTFYAIWVAEPAGIKLLDGSTVNHTNFITGVTAGTVNFDAEDHNCAAFGSTGGTIVGLTGLNKVVAYNATTTQTRVKFILYNTNSSEKELYLQKVLEGATEAVTETIAVPSKERHETIYYTYNSSDLRSFYVTVNSTNIKILQMKVIEDGTVLKRAGETGYELNLNQGRVFGAQNEATTFEGLAFTPSSNAKVLNSTELQIKTPLSFTIAAPLTLTVTTSSAKYYVSQNAAEDGTTATAITAAGTEEFNLVTTGTWYIVPSTTSAVKLTNIAFSAPKCAEPVIDAQPATKIDFAPGDLTASVTAHSTDGGSLSYKWYNASDDSEVAGATSATLTTTTEGTYYVIVTNSLAGHADNSIKSDEATLRYRSADDATLSSLTVSAGSLDPAFDPAVENYRVDLPEGTTDVPTLTATAAMAAYGATAGVTDATVFVDYEAVSTVLVTAEDGSTHKTYTVHFYVAHSVATLVDVTENTTWDWTAVTKKKDGTTISGDGPIVTEAVDGLVIANYLLGDNFDKVEGNNGAYALRSDSRKVYQGASLHIHTTKGGYLSIWAANEGTTQTLNVANEGRDMKLATLTGSQVEYKVYVNAGDVVIYNIPETSGKPMRVSKMIFTVDETPDYTRSVTNNIGTLCVDHNVPAGGAQGATFYQIAGKNAEGKLVFEEVTSLNAGEPYVFQSTTGGITLFYGETTAPDPVAVKGMIGSFTGEHVDIDDSNKTNIMYIANNKLWDCSDLVGSYLDVVANRAYIFNYAGIGAAPAHAPGKRYIVVGKDQATGFDQLEASETPMKLIIDGQLFILRGEKMYNANGQLVK